MTWEVESPEGVVLEIEGEEPPTGEQIRKMFAAFAPASSEPQLRAAPELVSAMPTEAINELPAPTGQLTEPPGKRAEQITQLLSALVTSGAGGVAATIPKGMSLLRPPGAISGPLSRLLRPAAQKLEGFKFPGPSGGSLQNLRTEAQEMERFFRHTQPGASQLPTYVTEAAKAPESAGLLARLLLGSRAGQILGATDLSAGARLQMLLKVLAGRGAVGGGAIAGGKKAINKIRSRMEVPSGRVLSSEEIYGGSPFTY